MAKSKAFALAELLATKGWIAHNEVGAVAMHAYQARQEGA